MREEARRPLPEALRLSRRSLNKGLEDAGARQRRLLVALELEVLLVVADLLPVERVFMTIIQPAEELLQATDPLLSVGWVVVRGLRVLDLGAVPLFRDTGVHEPFGPCRA